MKRISLESIGVEILIIVQNHVQLEDGSNYYMGPSSTFLYTHGLTKVDKPEIVLSSNLALIQQAVELLKTVADWVINDFHGTIEELLQVKLRLPNYPEIYFKQNIQSDGNTFTIIYTTLYDELLKSGKYNYQNNKNIDPVTPMVQSKGFKELLKDRPNLKVIKGGKTNGST